MPDAPPVDASSAASSSSPFDARTQAELMELFETALPIIVSYLMTFGLQIVSQMVVGRVSAGALASVALANMFANASGLAPILGTANACDTLCSEAFGSKNYARVGAIARRGVGVALTTAAIVAIVWNSLAAPFFRALEIESDLADDAAGFLRVLTFGLPAQVVVEVLKKPLISIGMAKMATILTSAGLFTSASLSAPLVFSTPLGVRGAAWATVIAHWVTLSVFVSFLYHHRTLDAFYRKFSAARPAAAGLAGEASSYDIDDTPVSARPAPQVIDAVAAAASGPKDWHDCLDVVFPRTFGIDEFFNGWPEYLALGIPSASMLFVEWGTFEALAVVAGRLGRVSLATHAVLATSAALSFMPFLGVSVAACVRTGSAMGANRPADAKRTLNVALALGSLVAAVNVVLILSCRSWWGEVFSTDAAVVDLTARVIPVLALYFVFDGAQCILSGVLRGAALAGSAAGINIVAYVGGILLAVGLSDPHSSAGWGLTGIWCAFVAAVFFASVAMMGMLQCKNWEKLALAAHQRGIRSAA
jgi:MATE family multidrug resistance protein